jgi:hypothetical protein
VACGRGERHCTAVACAAAMARCIVLAAGGSQAAAGDVARWGEPVRGREAAGQGPRRHVHKRRGVLERQGRRTWPGSGGGVWQRRSREGERGRRRGTWLQN